MTRAKLVSRRSFLIAAGGAMTAAGLSVAGLTLTPIGAKIQNRVHGYLDKPAHPLKMFVHVGNDNHISIVSHRAEMGQGIKTGLAQVLADEMDADWSRVRVLDADADNDYIDQETSNSRSMREFYPIMRQLGATVRLMLISAASNRWSVNAQECMTIQNNVVHQPSGRTLSYGELAEELRSLPIPSIDSLTLKKQENFSLIGQSVASVGETNMLTGQHQYPSDLTLPDMVYSVVKHAPVPGARLIELDDSEARQVPGFLDLFVLPENTFPLHFQALHGVAVIATNTWAAIQARNKLKCVWSESRFSSHTSEDNWGLLQSALENDSEEMIRFTSSQQTTAVPSQVVEAQYLYPNQTHAPMEPPVAVASYTRKGIEIWTGVQAPVLTRAEIARYLGYPQFKITVHNLPMGGAFGRKSKPDFCVQAAIIARQVRRPVKLQWTREDDLTLGYLHTQSMQHYQATLDHERRIINWEQRTAFASVNTIYEDGSRMPSNGELEQGFNFPIYGTPTFSTRRATGTEGSRIGWMRSVNNLQHAFGHASFVDEVANARNRKPLDHLKEMILAEPERLKLLADTSNADFDPNRLLRTIEWVDERRQNKTTAANEGWGFAAHYCFKSYVFAATKVRLEGDEVSVLEVHLGMDCGMAVNPDRIHAQLEGAVAFGLTAALNTEIHIVSGQVQESNFHRYQLLRNSQCPAIFTYIIPSEEAPTGVGEPGVPPIAPSLTNAIVAAGGKRIRQLPISRWYKV